MCKAPKPPAPKEPKKPQFLRNQYLDEFVGEAGAVSSLKAGRNSLRIDLGGSDAGSTSGSSTGLDTAQPGPAAIAPRVAIGTTGSRGKMGGSLNRLARQLRK